MNDIIKIVKSLKESGLLIKAVRQTIKNEAKEQKGGFLSMLLETLRARLLGNMLTTKGTIRASADTIRAGEGTIRVGQDFFNAASSFDKFWNTKVLSKQT